MSQTAQTWALVGATLGAVVITFIGSGVLQHLQSARSKRESLEQTLAESMAAAQDVMLSLRVVRQAHLSRVWAGRQAIIDLGNIVLPKLTSYTVVTVRLSLGTDEAITKAVRDLTNKVTALVEAAGEPQEKFESLTDDLQKELEDFRAAADAHLASRHGFWHRRKRPVS